ncbi:1-acyl-sn-glycerol-3-phosphate acyltransferase [Polynucleobacter sp. AP-Nino-20-G2]|uniref:lysophospholipid acyltransferase family protein n=1 Tax=Polynucleobacter sp. AP-Nino-20-G2 TaxID=2576917 RepID=UPI00203E0EEC|nr:lysophospholipid acyltransferase family protein [Polynucleobacter sp. AP-Nino-20-G2]QWE17450.1 1-acyl-sn-glycerol-3-phosphate acyltransferase [Polynucleobacter sp. AP-Nino-20-G2]
MKNVDHTQETIEASIFVQAWVWMQIVVHVICGVFILSLFFPFLDRKKKNREIQLWSKKLLRILNVKLVVSAPESYGHTPCLLASNHISWLDIHVINAFKPIRFVAKSEVKNWPVFGWMASQLGTVFIRRDSSRHARQVVHQMAEVLQAESICIFPEGTSSNGEHVLPFKPNLFESAIASRVTVFPLALQYIAKSTGLRSDAPAFIGDMGLLESMSRVIKHRSLIAKITILSPYLTDSRSDFDRKELADYCQKSIANGL